MKSTEEKKQQIFLLEDDQTVQTALGRALEREGFDVLAASSAEEAITLIESQCQTGSAAPCCFVLDIDLPGESGVAAGQRFREMLGSVPLVFISGKADKYNVNLAWRTGADDFLFKPFSIADLISSINKARSRHQQTRDHTRSNTDISGSFDRLTAREKQILALVSGGRKNQQISDALGISVRTVKMHRANLMTKLEIDHVADLVRFSDQCRYLHL